jgi:hypothetical protein
MSFDPDSKVKDESDRHPCKQVVQRISTEAGIPTARATRTVISGHHKGIADVGSTNFLIGILTKSQSCPVPRKSRIFQG